jgi:hypothetical protein
MKRSTPLRRDTGKAALSVPAPKTKRCAKGKGGCGERFLAMRPMQAACGPECAAVMAVAKRQKAERKADAAKRLEQKPISWFEKRAEDAVNRYVRLRDANRGCVSCNKPATWDGQWHASHWRSVGAATAIRFNLWNIHRACVECNHFRSGNIGAYRIAERIGDDKAEWLKTQNQIVRYTREYLERLRAVFSRKASRLARRQAEPGCAGAQLAEAA